jgi:hypothetical protein
LFFFIKSYFVFQPSLWNDFHKGMVKLFMVSRICKNWQDATSGWAAKIEGRPESYQSHSLTKLDRATLSNQPKLFVAYGKVKTDFLLPQFLCVKKKKVLLYIQD